MGGICMKKFLVLLMSVTITMCSTIVSFAGEWKQDNAGWYYQKDDGRYVKNDWLILSDIEKYHFDQNGYMQTGLVEVDGIQHYFYEDGRMTHNWDTPEGYKVDVDGRVIDENTPGINFKILWATGTDKGSSDLLVCRFINEGKTEFTVDPVVEINTDGMIKKLHMVDINTMTSCDYGIVPTNNRDTDFAFVLDGLQQFTINENSTLNFTVSCDSFVNSYYRIIPSMKSYRFHIDE